MQLCTCGQVLRHNKGISHLDKFIWGRFTAVLLRFLSLSLYLYLLKSSFGLQQS